MNSADLLGRITDQLMEMIEYHKSIERDLPENLLGYYAVHLKHMQVLMEYVASLESHARGNQDKSGENPH